MEHQSDINSAMRTILIDWLIEVADEYKLNDETLFLCVQYVDRFLSTVNVTRSKLQLLGQCSNSTNIKQMNLSFHIGTTCMYVASKYEEMYPPALDEFSFITDNTYETKHILRMEQIIMKVSNSKVTILMSTGCQDIPALL
jgi:cyclin A